MAYRSSSTLASASSTSAVVPVPTGAAINDIAVVAIYVENTDVITPPAGFTAKVDLATSPTLRGRLVVYWKRLTAADTGTYTFSWTNLAFRAASCTLYSGRVAAGDPFDGPVGSAEGTSTSTTLNVSASPTVMANGDVIGFWTNFNGGASWTAPGSYTQRQSEPVLVTETRDAVAAGSTGNVTATSSITDFMKAFLGVLKPAIAKNGSTFSGSNTGGTGFTFSPALTTAIGDWIVFTVVSNGTKGTIVVLNDLTFDAATVVREQQLGASAFWMTTLAYRATAALTGVTFTASCYTGFTSASGCFDHFTGVPGGASGVATAVGQSVASGTGGTNPALPTAPPSGDLVTCCGSDTAGTGWGSVPGAPYQNASFFFPGSQPLISQRWVDGADGTSTYAGTWTGGTSGDLAFQTVTVGVGSGAPPPVAPAEAGSQVWAPGFMKGERFPAFLAMRSPARMFLPQDVGIVASGPFTFTQGFTASVGFTSSDTLKTNKGLSATLGFTSSDLFKTIKAPFLAALSFTSSDAFRTNKLLSATLSFTSSNALLTRKNLSATLSFTGSSLRSIAKTFSATVGFTGSIAKRAGKALSATVGFTGSVTTAVVHFFTQLFTASLGFTSSDAFRTSKTIPATVGFTSSDTFRTSKGLSATVGFTGSITKRPGKLLAATVGFTSSQTRAIKKGLSATVGFTGSMTTVAVHVFTKLFTASVGFTGSVSTVTAHFFTKLLTATVGFTSSQTRRTSKSITATVGSTGSLSKRAGKALNATLSFVSSDAFFISTKFVAGLGFTGNVLKRTAKKINASLGLSATFLGVFGAPPRDITILVLTPPVSTWTTTAPGNLWKTTGPVSVTTWLTTAPANGAWATSLPTGYWITSTPAGHYTTTPPFIGGL